MKRIQNMPSGRPLGLLMAGTGMFWFQATLYLFELHSRQVAGQLLLWLELGLSL